MGNPMRCWNNVKANRKQWKNTTNRILSKMKALTCSIMASTFLVLFNLDLYNPVAVAFPSLFNFFGFLFFFFMLLRYLIKEK